MSSGKPKPLCRFDSNVSAHLRNEANSFREKEQEREKDREDGGLTSAN